MIVRKEVLEIKEKIPIMTYSQYRKDTSKKIRAVVKMRGEAGEHIASNPPYGYIKDPQDKRNGL